MANQFTSIATTPGLADNTVKIAYDLMIEKVYRAIPTYRSWVDKRPEQPTQPGSGIVINKYDWLSPSVITAAKTPLNEEQDVDSVKLPPTVPVTLTPKEYGMSVTKTRLIQLQSFAQVDTYAAEAIGNAKAELLDELVQDTMVTSTHKLYSSTHTAENQIVAGEVCTASLVRRSKTLLNGRNVPTMDGQFYAGGIHPYVLHDLREETGSGSWRVPNEYGTNQSKIWAGEFGEFEGVRFVANTRTRISATGASSANVYRTFITGRQAIAESVLQEPGFVVGAVVDKLARFRHVGFYGVLGWALFRDESLEQILSSTSLYNQS